MRGRATAVAILINFNFNQDSVPVLAPTKLTSLVTKIKIDISPALRIDSPLSAGLYSH